MSKNPPSLSKNAIVLLGTYRGNHEFFQKWCIEPQKLAEQYRHLAIWIEANDQLPWHIDIDWTNVSLLIHLLMTKYFFDFHLKKNTVGVSRPSRNNLPLEQLQSSIHLLCSTFATKETR